MIPSSRLPRRGTRSRPAPFECTGAPARRPAIVVSMASRTSASASTSGGSRCDSCNDVMPMTGAQRSRSATSARTVAGKHSLVDAALHAGEDACLEIRHERELLVFAADARHVPVEEHEREVLRLPLAELVEAPDRVADVVERVAARRAGELAGAEQAESFFGKGEEDGVLRRKVAVDRRRGCTRPSRRCCESRLWA